MCDYTIKMMETADEMKGKAYVHFQGWQETYGGLIDATYLETMNLEKCLQIAHSRPCNTIVAKRNEEVIGFVGYGKYRDEENPAVGEIFGIYVLAAHQGKKVGYQLMNAAIKELSDYPQIVLWVLKGNEKAIRFYEKNGFIFDGKEKEVLLGSANVELRMSYERK